MILAIDPGKDKCGLAVLEHDGSVKARAIIPRQEIIKSLDSYVTKFNITVLVIGDTAFGRKLAAEIKSKEIKFVSEKNSSLEARRLFWQENPPKGLWRFIPESLRLPPVPIDDYAAVILGQRQIEG